MNNKTSIHIMALAALGGGLSGGDRIFIEFARRWSEKFPVNIFVWEQGFEMCKRQNLSGKFLKIHIIKVGGFSKLGFIFTYFYRVFLGVKLGFSLKLISGEYVYSSSEFWMDTIPAFILKLRNYKIRWVAAWYQTAPNPLVGFTEGSREKVYKIRAFLYWFIQKTTKPIISGFADFILVNNDIERREFLKQDRQGKVFTVLGAVKVDEIGNYRKKHKPHQNKKYLAVFQGRFHPQKGIIELIDIWDLVIKRLPDAKLAIIGDGPLMSEVRKKVIDLNLEQNVNFFGYLSDGDKKYSLFNDSEIVVHPAFFDSGGMASAEAMAFGLPCIGFDLKSYLSYYPHGMIKVPIGDLDNFSNVIINLAKDKKLSNEIGKQGQEMIEKDWSWDFRAREVLSFIGYNGV